MQPTAQAVGRKWGPDRAHSLQNRPGTYFTVLVRSAEACRLQGSMPWKVSGAVEKRKAFVEEWLSGEWTMTELCARHAVSRQTGYNTVARYQSAGWESLEERSRSPLRHPNQTRPEIEQAILEVRYLHMRWGPRKLKTVLERDQPHEGWPAASTIGELLRRAGLVIARKKRRRVDPSSAPFA